MMHIVSDKMELINDYIINDLERGSTIICAKGGINKEDKEIIESLRSRESFKPNPSKEDRSFFDKIKDLFD